MSRVTAYHEAAHAVADVLCGGITGALHFGRGTEPFVDRKGRETHRALGIAETTTNAGDPDIAAMILKSNPELRPALWATAVNATFVAGAGAVGEAKVQRRGLLDVWLRASTAGDFEHSMTALQPYYPDEGARRGAVFEIWGRTSSLIATKAAWNAVAVTADALLASGGFLDGDVVNDLIRTALPEAPKRPLNHPITGLAIPMLI